MDHRILERLDAVRPGSNDLALPELAGAGDALRRDAELAGEFERRQEWDRRVAAAMHDVPVPAGLKTRLTSRLAVATPVPRFGRRRLLAIVSSLAASLVVGGAFWAATQSREPLALGDVRDAASSLLNDSATAAPFRGSFEPRVSVGLASGVRFEPEAKGLLDDHVAAWRFTTGIGRDAVSGVLACIPANELATTPGAGSIEQREYVGAANDTVAWREGDLVYVCYVDGGIDDLLRHLRDRPLA
jgi:hypothetical protein